jgi:hypothetical protein
MMDKLKIFIYQNMRPSRGEVNLGEFIREHTGCNLQLFKKQQTGNLYRTREFPLGLLYCG